MKRKLISHPFPTDVPDTAISDPSSRDRAWFKANPHRRYHLRPLYPEERTYLSGVDRPSTFIIVAKVTPVMRLRHSMIGAMPPDGDEIAEFLLTGGGDGC